MLQLWTISAIIVTVGASRSATDGALRMHSMSQNDLDNYLRDGINAPFNLDYEQDTDKIWKISYGLSDKSVDHKLNGQLLSTVVKQPQMKILDTFAHFHEVAKATALEPVTDGGNPLLLVIGINIGFIQDAMNLICSLERVGIPRSKVFLWALDEETQRIMPSFGVRSFFNSSLHHVSNRAMFGNEDYFSMMRERPKFFRTVLEAGYDMLFLDGDIVVLRDVHLEIKNLLQEVGDTNGELPDLVVQTDYLKYHFSRSHKYYPTGCAGVFYLRSTENSIRMTKGMEKFIEWVKGKPKYSQENDQTALNYMIQHSNTWVMNNVEGLPVHQGQAGLKVYFLSQMLYPNGHLMFSSKYSGRPNLPAYCDKASQEPGWTPVLIHANSLTSKYAAFKRFDMIFLDHSNGQCVPKPNLAKTYMETACKYQNKKLLPNYRWNKFKSGLKRIFPLS